MPLELVAFRTFEPALSRKPRMLGQFDPCKNIRVRGAYGDLAAMANVRSVRQYHDETLHTDAMGFRDPCDLADAHYAGIVAGDSFVVGVGEPEVDTLPGKLTTLAGAPFYNAGWNGVLIPGGVAYLAGELKIRSGVVVLEVLERTLKTPTPIAEDFPPGVFTSPQAAEQAKGASSFLPWLTDVQQKLSPSTPSPLQIISQKIIKKLQNDKLQPNPYWHLAVHETLANGDNMLFLPKDLRPVDDVDALSASWANYFEWYRNQLRPYNLKLIVLLVPNKYTVYGQWAAPVQADGIRLLNGVEHRLEAKGIPVVNLTGQFREVAAEQLPEHRYLYWRDDTHWNAEGIALAADRLWNSIRTLEPQLHPSSQADKPN